MGMIAYTLGSLQVGTEASLRGADVGNQYLRTFGVPTPVVVGYNLLRLALTGVGAWHGYRRNETVLSAIGYGALASFLPMVSMIVMGLQGIGEEK